MRTAAEKIELCKQFVQDNAPHWIFNPDLIAALQLREIRFCREDVMRGNRGYALEHNVRVSAVTAKWRHASPYTAPCGKADLSPLGVMVHEMGHILEFASWRVQDGPRLQQEWKALHRDRRREAVTSYARSHWREDLAESHRLFVLNPKLLKELSPERFHAIRDLYKALLNTERLRQEFKLSPADFRRQFHLLVH
jgi:hypothetical protein